MKHSPADCRLDNTDCRVFSTSKIRTYREKGKRANTDAEADSVKRRGIINLVVTRGRADVGHRKITTVRAKGG